MNEELRPLQTVLLAVTGMSPAVLTETIWALCLRSEPVIPDRIVVVTTTAGAERIREQLFTPNETLDGLSVWQTLRDRLQLSGCDIDGKLRFGTTSDDIRVFTALDQNSGLSYELDDIRSPEDNESVADALLDQVRMFTENPDTRLIASLAGGRKTMGALLYACMTLAGREEDLLTHVLVNEPFDATPGFFFPGQPGGPLKTRGGQQMLPEDAVIDLAEVPFVALRNLFAKELGRQVGSFNYLVEQCRLNVRTRAGESIRLIVEVQRSQVHINNQLLKLSAREQMVFLFLAKRAKQKEPAYSYYGACLDDLNAFREELIQVAIADDFRDWRGSDVLNEELNEKSVARLVSDLRRKIQGLSGDACSLAGCLPEKGRFSLDVEPSLIEIR